MYYIASSYFYTWLILLSASRETAVHTFFEKPNASLVRERHHKPQPKTEADRSLSLSREGGCMK